MADTEKCPSCHILHLPTECPEKKVVTVMLPPQMHTGPLPREVTLVGAFDVSSPAYREAVEKARELPEVQREIARRATETGWDTTDPPLQIMQQISPVLRESFQVTLAKRMAQRSPIVREVLPSKRRRWPISFGPVAVEPGKTEIVQVQPKVLFRGEKIVCTGQVDDLTLEGFFVGQKPQLPELWAKQEGYAYRSGRVSLQHFFAECARLVGAGEPPLMDVCDGALQISISVRNRSDEYEHNKGQPYYTPPVRRVFSMTIVGEAVVP